MVTLPEEDGLTGVICPSRACCRITARFILFCVWSIENAGQCITTKGRDARFRLVTVSGPSGRPMLSLLVSLIDLWINARLVYPLLPTYSHLTRNLLEGAVPRKTAVCPTTSTSRLLSTCITHSFTPSPQNFHRGRQLFHINVDKTSFSVSMYRASLFLA